MWSWTLSPPSWSAVSSGHSSCGPSSVTGAAAEEIPRQFQYHGPVEVLYTIIPIVIVLVIFGFTVVTENNIDALASSPAAQVKITAFQWGWEFQYPNQNIIVLGHTTQDP